MMNKKRLAALALSAVMAASTMSIPVYAADFSDGATAGAEVQVQSDFTSDAAGSANVEVQVAEPAEETVEAAGVSEGGLILDPKSVEFSYNEPGYFKQAQVYYELYNPDYPDDDSKREKKCTTPEIKAQKAATCTEPGKIQFTITLYEHVFDSIWFDIPDEPELGDRAHNYKEIDRAIIEKANHQKEGRVKVTYRCALCGDIDYKEEKVDRQAHTWSTTPVYFSNDENVVTDDEGHVVFEEDGTVKLKNPMKNGRYEARYYCTAEECVAVGEYRSEVKVQLAKKGHHAIITAVSDNIVNYYDLLDKRFDSPTEDLKVDEDTIELEDCRDTGWYTVTYYNEDNDAISSEKVIVEPHHYWTYKTVVFASKDDKDECDVTYDENGEPVVTNNSCYKPISYTVVTHCQAKNCYGYAHNVKGELEANDYCYGESVVNEVEKVAEPAGKHLIKESVYTNIDWASNNPIDSKFITYNWLVHFIENAGATDYVKLSARPSCTEGGTVTVNYICVLDNETVVKTQTVNVNPTEHKEAVAIRENYVAPTCDEMGFYQAVVYCEYCGEELERRDVKIPRIAHSNEISVDQDGSGKNDDDTDTTAYLKFTGDKVVDIDGETLQKKGEILEGQQCGEYGYKEDKTEFMTLVDVYTNCEVCGNHEIPLDADKQAEIDLKVVDVQKQSDNGKAGSITLEATYKIQSEGENKGKTITAEITLPYFSSIEAYQGRLEEQPEIPEDKLNGLHWDEDGECRYYVDGELQKDFSGILEYEGKSFVLNNGVLCRTASGLNLIDDEWYYLTEGRIRTDVTQVVMYDGEWFYVTEGKLDTTVDDLVSYDGETFVYVDGRYAQEGNGLWIGEDGVWYFLSNGRVAKEHTGLAMYDNEWFYVVNGKLAVDFNGTVDFEGGTFKVVGGMVKEQVK